MANALSTLFRERAEPARTWRLLATQAWSLSSFGFMPMADEEWQQVFDDILRLVVRDK